MSGSTGCLSVFSPEHSGKLYLEFGHLIHAECPSFLGEEALWALLRVEPDDLEFDAKEKTKQKTITRPTELILMESAVHVDQPERIGRVAQSESDEQDPPNYFRVTTSVQFQGDQENARKLYILSQGTTSVGRSHSNDLIIGDKTVSRLHAEIVVSDQKVSLKDLAGRNGTRLNNRQVMEADLKSNDSITFGMVTLRFYWSQKGEPVLVQEPLKSPINSAPTGPIKLLPPR
jgi:hypothetical protein